MNPRRIPIHLVLLSGFFLGTGCRPQRDCPTGQYLCEGTCTDPSIDVKNCGACSHACAAGETCQAGLCACPGALVPCAGVCSDLQSSAANCGSCGHACSSTDACFNGQCGTSCPDDAGVIDCSGSCVNSGTDPHNCGTCAHACQAKELCEQGTCEAPDLYAVCYYSGSLIGYHSETGVSLPPFTVSVTLADGGAPIVPSGVGLLFTDAKTLWLLDSVNSLVDVLDVTNWPPSVLGSVSVGQSANQLVLCDGMVLVVNSVDGTVQGLNPTTRQTINEVSLGAGTNPYYLACDGAHTAYVSDWVSGDVKAIDLDTWAVTATLTIPPQYIADGGSAFPQGIAYVKQPGWDAGSVFVSLGNATLTGGFVPLGNALVLELDAALQGVLTVLDPGPNCVNGAYLAVSQDGNALYESCGGVYNGPTSGFVAPIGIAQRQVGPLISVPLGNPFVEVALKNGLLAVDGSGNQVVVFNPYDAGVVQLLAPCPTLPDGGTVAQYDFVGGLARAAP